MLLEGDHSQNRIIWTGDIAMGLQNVPLRGTVQCSNSVNSCYFRLQLQRLVKLEDLNEFTAQFEQFVKDNKDWVAGDGPKLVIGKLASDEGRHRTPQVHQAKLDALLSAAPSVRKELEAFAEQVQKAFNGNDRQKLQELIGRYRIWMGSASARRAACQRLFDGELGLYNFAVTSSPEISREPQIVFALLAGLKKAGPVPQNIKVAVEVLNSLYTHYPEGFGELWDGELGSMADVRKGSNVINAAAVTVFPHLRSDEGRELKRLLLSYVPRRAYTRCGTTA